MHLVIAEVIRAGTSPSKGIQLTDRIVAVENHERRAGCHHGTAGLQRMRRVDKKRTVLR